MNAVTRRALVAAITLVVVLVAAAPASAAELLSERVSVGEAVDRSCFEELSSGPGVARRDFTAADTGHLRAALRGTGGDWDLAVFRRSGRDAIAASAYRGADEVAGGYALKGEELTVQACRRSGEGDAADLTVDLEAIDTSGTPETISLVEVSVPTAARKRELVNLDLDLTEHGGEDFVEVVLRGAADAKKLTDAKFVYKVEVPDLLAQSKLDRQADQRFAATTQASALPSDRTSYRHLADYSEEMKQLAATYPDLVKPITLPFKTWEGRPVEGLEITTNPNARDGKPVFLQMGLHHAREWPSGEHALEWAYELVQGYRSGDARIKPLVEGTRTIVVPVVNPDGFNNSREAGELQGGGDGRGTPNEGEEDEIVNILAHPYEYRRKNCRFANDSEGGSCAQPSAGLASAGVDPNRNYGGFWGGPGAGASPESETYRGPGPFSEPETRNVRDIVSKRQVTTLITNHTFSNLVLRPPGIQSQGETPDEPLYNALGQAMSNENGYTNQFSYQLYDTTGTTEDWSYYTTGGLGFTFEIGCVVKADDGACDTGHFHPPFEEMVKEYDGRTAFSDTADRDGGGNREAYFKAQEHTADPSNHAVLTGTAPPGAILRLAKEFDTPTSQKHPDGSPKTFRDRLDTTLQVPDSGRFEWHINQSTRPLVARDKGRAPTGPPSDPQSFSGSPASAQPCADFDNPPPTCVDDHVFTVPGGEGVDNASATVRIEWATPASDWDLKLYRDVDNDGAIGPEDGAPVSTSGQGTTDFEQTTITEPVLVPGAQYIARVINWAATEPYDGSITFGGPNFERAQKESWTLTCEPTEGQPATTQPVTIDRGQSQQLELGGCAQRTDTPVGGSPPPAANQPSGGGERGRDRREKPRLAQKMRASYNGRSYSVRATGRLLSTDDRDGLSGALKAQRCAGTVTVGIKLGKRRLILRRATVTKKCTFARTLKFSRGRVPRSQQRRAARIKLRSLARYNGSKFLLPARSTKKAPVKLRGR